MMELKKIINLLRETEGYASFNAEFANEIADALEKVENEKENLVHYNADLNNQLNKAESHIEKLEKQPEWISVEDRLPKSEFVLCTDGKYCFVTIIPDMEAAKADGVTHWMPLPEPPKPKVPTFKDVFFEKFPKAVMEMKGSPRACLEDIFPYAKHYSNCRNNACYDCWNQPYFDEEGEADA